MADEKRMSASVPLESPLSVVQEGSASMFANESAQISGVDSGEKASVDLNKKIRRYWNAPVLRQLWGMEQKVDKVAWFELFYDLIYVALAINLSAFLKKHTDVEGVATAALYFLQLFCAWNALTMYESRFFSRDVFGTALKFLYSTAVLFMNVFVLDGLKSRLQFSLAAAAYRVCLLMMYIQVYFLVPRARAFAKVAIAGNMAEVFLFVGAAFMPKVATAVTWIVASLLVPQLWVSYIYRHTQTSIPINVEHIAERYGLFIMLMHGETIIAIGTDTSVTNSDEFGIIFWGFLIVFCLHNIYYGSLPKEPENHALRRSGVAGRAFIYLHIVLGFALVAVGTALSELKKGVSSGKDKKNGFRLLGFSIALFMVSVNAIRLTHNFKVRSPTVWLFRAVLIAIIITLPFSAGEQPPQRVALIYAVFMVLLVNIETVKTADEYEEGEAALNKLPIPPKEMKIEQMKSITPDKQTFRMKSKDSQGGTVYIAPPLKRQDANSSMRIRHDHASI